MLFAAACLTALLAIMTLLPFLPLAHGIVRIGDFPRQQVLVIAVLLAVASLVAGADSPEWRTLQAILGAVAAVQAWFILPFTPLWRHETASFDEARDDGHPVRLLACNVKMSNDKHQALATEIRHNEPDIVALMEVDDIWFAALREVLTQYPHRVERPQDNSYGMVLASRFPLDDVLVECMLTEGVPSIRATVTTPDGLRFRIYSIHPEPPVPGRGTRGRDGETALVALKVREETLPVLVTGDLNDVAWSRTTRRFRRIGRLLDPRIGRKVFSTFDARYPLIRWPLDHLFHSPEFRLAGMRRLRPCGSDHFPVLFDLAICTTALANSKPPAPTQRDLKRARELAEQARQRDKPPIGSDWEE